MPPWKQISFCRYYGQRTGALSWPTCSGQRQGCSASAPQICGPGGAPVILRRCVCVAVEGLIQAKEKAYQVICEVKSLLPPLHPQCQKERKVGVGIASDCGRQMWWNITAVSVLSLLRTWILTAADWRKNFSLVAVWGKCNLWAPFWRLWTPCKHLYYTVSSVVFVILVPPSAILTIYTVQIWMQFQAVMSQGCLRKVTKPQWPFVIRESLSCQPFKKKEIQEAKLYQWRSLNTPKAPNSLANNDQKEHF